MTFLPPPRFNVARSGESFANRHIKGKPGATPIVGRSFLPVSKTPVRREPKPAFQHSAPSSSDEASRGNYLLLELGILSLLAAFPMGYMYRRQLASMLYGASDSLQKTPTPILPTLPSPPPSQAWLSWPSRPSWLSWPSWASRSSLPSWSGIKKGGSRLVQGIPSPGAKTKAVLGSVLGLGAVAGVARKVNNRLMQQQFTSLLETVQQNLHAIPLRTQPIAQALQQDTPTALNLNGLNLNEVNPVW